MNNMKSEVAAFKILNKTYALLFKRCPGESLMLILFTVLGGIFSGIITYFWKLIFEGIYNLTLGNESLKRFIFIFLFLLCVSLIKKIFDILGRVYLPKFIEQIKFSILAEIHETIKNIPLEYYEDPALYDTIHRANQVVSSNTFLRFFMGSYVALSNMISAITVSLVLASFNPWLIVLCFISVIPPFVARLVRGSRYYYMQVYQTPKIRIQDYLWSLLVSKDSMKEIRVFGSGDYLRNKWANYKKDLQQEEWEFIKEHSLAQLIIDSSTILGLGFGIFSLVLMMMNNNLGLGELGASMIALRSVQNSFTSFLVQISLVGERVPHLSDFFKFVDMDHSDENENIKFTQLGKEIQLSNVCFRYHGTENNVLEDINLTIKMGETIALLGHNGAGKSTLVKLIMGLYKPTSGTIMYDRNSIAKYDRDSLYNQMSPVYQDYGKYHLMLRDNVAFGDINYISNDQAIMNAIDSVELKDELKHLPNGLDTQMGREFDGIELSIGQWQKLAIARGIIGNKDIMILDEPTASLDPMIEASVFHKFAEFSKDKTTILVSHRIGSAKMADRVVILEAGKIIEVGSHKELIKKRGKYFELYNLQAQWYKE